MARKKTPAFDSEFLTKPQRAFCSYIVLGEDILSAFRKAFPNSSEDEVKRDAPLLRASELVRTEIERLRKISPHQRLLERTQALIEGGTLQPAKELEAIELVSDLMVKVSEETKQHDTPEDLDEFMRQVVSGGNVLFR